METEIIQSSSSTYGEILPKSGVFQHLPGGLVSNAEPLDLLQADGACEELQQPPTQNSAKVEFTNEDKLIKVKNYINSFKTRIESLKKTNKQLLEYLDEKNHQMVNTEFHYTSVMSDIENNMKRHYVENWTVTDSNGVPGNFCGNIKWIKGGGTISYVDRTYFKGAWDSTGEITNGTLFNHMDDVIKKWKNGTLVEEDESDTEDELKELYYEIYAV